MTIIYPPPKVPSSLAADPPGTNYPDSSPALLPGPTAFGYVPIAASGSVYFVYQDSFGTHAVNAGTGVADFTNTDPTDATSVLDAITNPATYNAVPVLVQLSPEIQSASLTYGASCKTVSAWMKNGDFGNLGAPIIGQIGFNPPANGSVADVRLDGVTFYELDWLAGTWSTAYVTNVSFTSCCCVTSAANGHQGIVFDGGTSSSYAQYVDFWELNIYDGLGAGTTGLTYPTGGFITVIGGSTSTAHFRFHSVNYQINSGASGSMAFVHMVDNASTATQAGWFEFGHITVNSIRAPSSWSYLIYDAASSSPQSLELTILQTDFLYLEVHTPNVTLLTAGSRTSGFLTGALDIGTLSLTVNGATSSFTIAENSTTNWSTGLSYVRVGHIHTGFLTSGATIEPGTMNECQGLQYYIGTFYSTQTGTSLSLVTGGLIGTPVSNGRLSVGGTGAWAAGTSYICGGTPLKAVVTGTVTLTSAGGTTGDLLNAASLTDAVLRIEPGQALLVAASGTAVFAKGA